MATNYYVSALAGGGGTGTELNPWTLAEGIAAINALAPWAHGDTLYIKNDGIYSTTGIKINDRALETAVSKIIGYTDVITDGGMPKIVRASGTSHLLDIRRFWQVWNLELDGNNTGGYGLYVTDGSGDTYVYNINSHNNTIGFYATQAINCIAHNNSAQGFIYGSLHLNCIAYKNGQQGFYRGMHYVNCIGYYNTKEAFQLWAQGSLINSIAMKSTAYAPVYVNRYPITIINSVIADTPDSGTYGIFCNAVPYECVIMNCNFWNILGGESKYCNFPAAIKNCYSLDPQFKDIDNLDFTRTGINLDDLGLSEVGLVTGVNYKIPIAIGLFPIISAGGERGFINIG